MLGLSDSWSHADEGSLSAGIGEINGGQEICVRAKRCAVALFHADTADLADMGTGDDIFTHIPPIFLNTDALPMPKGDRKNLRNQRERLMLLRLGRELSG